MNAVAEVVGVDRIRSEEGENGEEDKESAGDDGDDRKNVAKAVVVMVAPALKRHGRERGDFKLYVDMKSYTHQLFSPFDWCERERKRR